MTNEYSAFNDIIQPIQVAVFEMKLGLSLILSSALENESMHRIGQDNSYFVMVSFPKPVFLCLVSSFDLMIDIGNPPGNYLQSYEISSRCFEQDDFC